MAIKPSELYPDNTAPATPDYPYGEAVDVLAPGDGTGTPWKAPLINDILGGQQALLAAAGIEPNGSPDTAQNSQYLDALKEVTRITLGGSDGADKVGFDNSITVADRLRSLDFETLSALVNVSSTLAGALAGYTVKTKYNNSTSKRGGAKYYVKTLAQHRTDIGNGSWVPDGNGVIGGDHYIGGGTTYVAVLTERDYYKISVFGAVADFSGGVDAAPAANSAIAYAASNGGGVVVVDSGNHGVGETILLRPHVPVISEVPSVNSSSKGSRLTLLANTDKDVMRTYVSNGVWPPNVVNDYVVGGGVRKIQINGNRPNQTGANDPVTGNLPNGITASRWIELSTLEDLLVGNCVGRGIRVEESTLPFTGKNLSLGNNGVAGLSIGDFVSACTWENISASATPTVVEFDAQVTDISGHNFINPHFEQNGVAFGFTNASSAPVHLINATIWGRACGVDATASSTAIIISNLLDYMVGQQIEIPGAGVAGADLNTTLVSIDTGAGTAVIADAASTTVSGVTAHVGVLAEYTGSTPNLVMTTPSVRELAATIDDNGTLYTYNQTDMALYIEKGKVTFGANNTNGEIRHETYNDATLAGTWANSGGTSASLSYLKCPSGLVQLKGNISSGASGSTITTLPSGYRPAHRLYFSVFNISTGSVARLYIDTTGDVVHVTGSTTSLTLDAINFTV